MCACVIYVYYIEAIMVSWAAPSIRALCALGDKQTGSRPVLLSLEANASQRKVGSHPAHCAQHRRSTVHVSPQIGRNGFPCGLYCRLQGGMMPEYPGNDVGGSVGMQSFSEKGKKNMQ